jgi:hypothetical protein
MASPIGWNAYAGNSAQADAMRRADMIALNKSYYQHYILLTAKAGFAPFEVDF